MTRTVTHTSKLSPQDEAILLSRLFEATWEKEFHRVNPVSTVSFGLSPYGFQITEAQKNGDILVKRGRRKSLLRLRKQGDLFRVLSNGTSIDIKSSAAASGISLVSRSFRKQAVLSL